jgi:hypothetical protein
MGRELTPQEMVDILNKKASLLPEDDLQMDLIGLRQGIECDMLGNNHCHAKHLAENPQTLIDNEIKNRDSFQLLTGIDSRNCDLPAEDGGFEAE